MSELIDKANESIRNERKIELVRQVKQLMEMKKERVADLESITSSIAKMEKEYDTL